MLKTAGIFIIFAVLVFRGCDAARTVSLRLQYAETLCRLCRRLCDGIKYNRASAAEIAATYDYGADLNAERFSHLLSASAPELYTLLCELMGKLAVCGGEEAVRLCGYYSERFTERRDELAAETPKKRRLYATLGVTAAVAAVVILM